MLSGVPLQNILVADTALNLTGVPDPTNPDTLLDLINMKLGDTENTEEEIDAIDAGRSQNTVPIASTQVAIKGIVQHSTRVAVAVASLVS